MYIDIEKTKKLDGYTKAEVITALVRNFHGSDIDRLICYLESERLKDIIAKQEKADADETAAMQAYLGWRRELIKKYGDGEQVRLIDLPRDEIIRGAALEKAWTEARKKSVRLEFESKSILYNEV